MSAEHGRGLLQVAGGILARGLSHASTLLLMLAAARLLEPAAFGAYVLGTALVALGMLFIYAGVYEYLLRADQHRLRSDAGFSLLLLCALGLAGLHLAGAGLAARAFSSPALAEILRAFAVIPLAGCLSAWREALYLRDSRHVGRYNLVIALRDGASLLIGLAGLWAGWGLAALVLSRVATALLGWAAWRALTRFEPAWDGDRSHWREVLAYGGGITGSRVAAYLEANGVDLLLGLLMQPATVGLYRMASRLVGAVVDLLGQPLAKQAWVRVSEAARAGRSPLAESAVWHRLMLWLAWPALAFTALNAQALSSLVLGPHWAGSAPVVSALAVAGLVRCAAFSLEPLLATQGQSLLLLRGRSALAALSLVLVPLAVPLGLVGVAASQALVALAGVGWMLWAARRHAGLPFKAWAQALALPAGLVLAMALCALASQAALAGRPGAAWWQMAAVALVGLVGTGAGLRRGRGEAPKVPGAVPAAGGSQA